MNDTHPRRRNPRPGRARKRAIREQAARTGVPYSVAARAIAELGLQPGESIASHGRTIYPCDSFRQSVVEQRERRTFAERQADTRRAAVLPAGRAQHLVDRFPPGRGLTGSGVCQLYHGEGRAELLTMLYLTVAVESPPLVPDAAGLAWAAELGEDTALDLECAELDRAARALLENNIAELDRAARPPLENSSTALWPRLAAALSSAASGSDHHLRLVAERLTTTQPAWERADVALPFVTTPPYDGVRQILDALLMVAEDGHAPGTRVRVLAGPESGRPATIVGAVWGVLGPPIAYRIQLDGSAGTLGMAAGELIVLAGQESLPG
ncbi:hypothetical protein FB565_000064 [Actinoplanes lutulentus]|uniref:Uncharacterized protein n=1 Tax=Actinoplanes lutulentus TaxID=1287878 RepID=A0A327Z2D9_9ACTN|nr:hypothetical protein [Actinoplanes lutulentus]MBB2940360.1 hypothetical protein [Actinoplanes lutulentus]RAK28853.1 hypothetical protein B0I29_119191 [Actinoplanes lutulentus]